MSYPEPDDMDAIDAAAEAAYRRRQRARRDFQRTCIEARVGDDSDPDVEWEESDRAIEDRRPRGRGRMKMAYEYTAQREKVFTDEGQRMFLRARDFAVKALKEAGAVRCQQLMGSAGGGDSWTILACVDRLVELGEIREIPQDYCAAQDRVFVAKRCD